MNHPQHIDLPFFAYGIFKPGQLAFFQLKELVKTIVEPATIQGSLHIRDGLLFIKLDQEGEVNGALLEFYPESRDEAYERISMMEPDKIYCYCTCCKSTDNLHNCCKHKLWSH